MFDSGHGDEFIAGVVAGDASAIAGVGIDGSLHGADLDVHIHTEGLTVDHLEELAHDALTHHFSYAAGVATDHSLHVVRHVDSDPLAVTPHGGSISGS